MSEAEGQSADGPETVADLDPDRRVWYASFTSGGQRMVHLVRGPDAAADPERTCRYAERADLRPVTPRALWDDQPVCSVCREVVGDE